MALTLPPGIWPRLDALARSLCPRAHLVNSPGAISRLPPGAAPFFAFYFSRQNFDDGRRQLALAATRGAVLVADFCLAERNLTLLPVCLARLTFGGRRDFWRRGAVEGLCSGLAVARRLPLLCGAATLALLAPAGSGSAAPAAAR